MMNLITGLIGAVLAFSYLLEGKSVEPLLVVVISILMQILTTLQERKYK